MFHIKIDEATHKLLKIEAAQRTGVNMGDIVRAAVQEYLQKNPESIPPRKDTYMEDLTEAERAQVERLLAILRSGDQKAIALHPPTHTAKISDIVSVEPVAPPAGSPQH